MQKYESDFGFLTSIWGPGLWHFLHTISFNYPVKPTRKQKQEYTEFILNVQHVLPCKHCRENFPLNLRKVPLTAHALKNRNNFSRWMYRFHKHINEVLGKETLYSFEQIREMYEEFRAKCSPKNKSVKKSVKKSKNEKGCVIPAKKQTPKKCVLRIVPLNDQCPPIEIL